MRIAIVGSGISGLACAHALRERHDVVLLEADDRAGGHAHTHELTLVGRRLRVDSGFIVCNDRTYPGFLGLLRELGVPLRETSMSFSVSAREHDFEYHGDSLSGLFAQRRNALDPRFLRMVAEYARFNRVARRVLEQGDETTSLRELLRRERFSPWFAERLIVPQASAVWSADPEQLWSFPALFLLRFFANHGMLSLRDRPTWLTVDGGSARYVEALLAPFGERLRLSAPVTGVARRDDHVLVRVGDRPPERFDHVVLACHGDQALALLEDPTAAESAILGAFPYRENRATLHHDRRLLPRRRRAWSSWNAHLLERPKPAPTVTYDLHRLQGLPALPDDQRLLVTLNLDEAIAPAAVLRRMTYQHPVFTSAGLAAQRRWGEISGGLRERGRTHFCGAYWRWGFHEDGCWSGLRVARALGGRRLAAAEVVA
ncbi:NAD(P)/FAD-dependent oxidoreductase [Patulibacter defluvii]|uniref:NAD(P)/FAD-dependent oxidoreductase n=1 Tax=Patulibacter defluvii TaxID=3095358 RepID=UPI002A75304F|nr:FAD-dependent oxidoreductase [Patulibacter sp. DM4]